MRIPSDFLHKYKVEYLQHYKLRALEPFLITASTCWSKSKLYHGQTPNTQIANYPTFTLRVRGLQVYNWYLWSCVSSVGNYRAFKRVKVKSLLTRQYFSNLLRSPWSVSMSPTDDVTEKIFITCAKQISRLQARVDIVHIDYKQQWTDLGTLRYAKRHWNPIGNVIVTGNCSRPI